MANPFNIVSAEVMNIDAIGAEFVGDHSEYAKLASYSHTLILGSRGTGKSMHLRILEPIPQAQRRSAGFDGDVRRFLEADGAFIGVYINCRDSALNRSEFKSVHRLPGVNETTLRVVFDHYMGSNIAVRICDTILSQLPWLHDLPVSEQEIPVPVSQAYEDDVNTLGDLLLSLRHQSALSSKSIAGIIEEYFLQSPEKPSFESFPETSIRLAGHIGEFCRFLKLKGGLSVPFFLLFDEVNELSRIQQECVNSLIAERSQQDVCVKIASQLHGYTTQRSSSDNVDLIHDYTTINLEGLYTNNQQAYYRRAEGILNERLERAGIAKTIQDYIPPNPGDAKDMTKARQIAEKRYLAIPEAKRPNDKANFIKKYAPAILFQEVRHAKAANNYAGFDNLVHLSSGIVRAVIDCCSRMYTGFNEQNPGMEPDSIPVSIQNEVIQEYSDEFIEAHILERIEGLDPDAQEKEKLEALLQLLLGLGALFRHRLMDRESREPRIISISIKDKIPPLLGSVLVLAEKEAFLHKKWYRSKRGNRNLPCYVLNRRLCPHFNLDPSGFQGRLEVRADELAVALEEPDKFVQLVLNRSRGETVEDENQLALFEW